jgi:hypothetical protein
MGKDQRDPPLADLYWGKIRHSKEEKYLVESVKKEEVFYESQ